MIHILTGPDSFSKREYVDSLAQKTGARLESFYAGEAVPDVRGMLGADLFSQASIYVFVGMLGSVLTEENKEDLVKSKNHFFFIEEKLDKRSTFTKSLAADKSITIKEFALPHGKELNKWISQRVSFLGGTIMPAAVDVLAVRLGRDQAQETKIAGKIIAVTEIYDLWQADNEIKKLLSYAAGREIAVADVEALSLLNEDTDALKIVNAIGEADRVQSFNLLHSFMNEEPGSDEKAKIIQLNALLSDQFRNIFIIQGLLGQGMPEGDIMEKTGWKSGRVFVLKKIAGRFSPKKVMDVLGKLEALDEELKTSNTPPRVLLDMIITQLLM